MNIAEFAKQYCPELIKDIRSAKETFPLGFLYYDEIITEQDGEKVRVIHTDNYTIPIMDIITADRKEFEIQWPYEECLIAYDNYVNNLIISEGAEVFEHVKASMRKSIADANTFAFM